MTATLTLRGATISRGPQLLISNASFTIAPGDRIGLVGPNGIGKSTLLAALAGDLPLDHGERTLAPPTANVGWLHQERDHTTAASPLLRADASKSSAAPASTGAAAASEADSAPLHRDDASSRLSARTERMVLDVLRQRTGVAAADRDMDAATEALAAGTDDAAELYDSALQRWLAIGAADFDARVCAASAEVGLDTRLLGQPLASLSGGEAARVGLAALLLSRFDLYLLDEPTNDLDLAGLDMLERWVLSQAAGMMIVSHDRRFLERVATSVAEIDHHAHTVELFGGGWQSFIDERERARQHAIERYENYDSQRRSLAARAQRQREWTQQGRSKVTKSGESDKHIRNFKTNQTEKLAGKAAQTQRAIDRLEVVESPREPWELRLTVPDAERSGQIVARLTDATVDRDEFRLGPLDLLIEYGERIAIVGPNGAGKSTLIDLILGRVAPTTGTAQLGSGVVIGEVQQLRHQLETAPTLLRSFTDATGLDTGEARTLLAKFGLVADHVTRPTESLSPGERTRATLALLMANGANLLVLDEPTNHLDLPAIEQLEVALDTFAGTVLLVTHDRALLERTHITRTIQL